MASRVNRGPTLLCAVCGEEAKAASSTRTNRGRVVLQLACDGAGHVTYVSMTDADYRERRARRYGQDVEPARAEPVPLVVRPAPKQQVGRNASRVAQVRIQGVPPAELMTRRWWE